MKKALSIVIAVSAVAASLTACGAPKPRAVDNSTASRTITESAETVENETKYPTIGSIEIEVERNVRLGDATPIAGVRRRLPNYSGEYAVEYVHSPRNEPKDDTLNYSLNLRDDNTYDMRVVTDGVEANHYGNWYLQSSGGIILYFDEPLDPTAHNVYVSDCMYGELLPHGKIMIYDDGNVIVLSKSDVNPESRTKRPVTLPDFAVLYGRA